MIPRSAAVKDRTAAAWTGVIVGVTAGALDVDVEPVSVLVLVGGKGDAEDIVPSSSDIVQRLAKSGIDFDG